MKLKCQDQKCGHEWWPRSDDGAKKCPRCQKPREQRAAYVARKSWRCFHCDEIFRSRKAAWAHFGDDSYCTKELPACIDPLRNDEKKRITDLREAQKYALDMENEARELDDRVDGLEMELAEFKALTKSSINPAKKTEVVA